MISLRKKRPFKTGPDHSPANQSPLLKKRLRLSDLLAEYVIKAVALLSITFVILIFVFVFRESLPLFKPEKAIINKNELHETDSGAYQTSDNGSLTPEVYEQETLKPEVYGTEELKPEVYGEELVPERYGIETEILDKSDTIQSLESSLPIFPANENRAAVSTLFSRDWQPVSDNPRFGLVPLFIGTLKVTLIAILFAAPIAILAAIYTALFAPPRLREILKPALELLAGFPSVVIGFFALMVLASFFQDLLGYSGRLNAFIGGFAMALAAIPVIYTLTDDALTSVPSTYTEASLGLGASLRQTAFKVVLPAATPGIFAAIILGIGRVFGETMIALMATGNAALISFSPFDSVRTLSATIGAEMAEVVFGDSHYNVLFLIGSLLFIFTFALNALAEFYFRNRVIRRFQGKQA